VAADGSDANDHSGWPVLNADGRFVVFSSPASNLVPGDTNGVHDVFLRDLRAGTIERVSLTAIGSQFSRDSIGSGVSDDGRYVVFLVESNAIGDVYVRDRLARTTTLVNVTTTGERPTVGATGRPAISGDGRFVAFRSEAADLVPNDMNGLADVFVRDLVAGRTERVSVSSAGEEGVGPIGRLFNGDSDVSISRNGQFVVFRSSATNLVGNDTNGIDDLFVRDRLAGVTERVSVGTGGTEHTPPDPCCWSGAEGTTAVSSDGRFVAFSSFLALNPDDTNGFWDVFVRDRREDTTIQISRWAGASVNVRMSTDARFVLYESDAAPGMPLGTLFLHDRARGTTIRVSGPASGEEPNGPSYDGALAGDGHVIAIASFASNLAAGDDDDLLDIFVREFSIRVTSTGDEVDATPGDGACATASGVCTLRAAIQEANATPGHDAITLPAGTYRLTLAGAADDTAAAGDLDIAGDLTIGGTGDVIVDGNGDALGERVFHVTGPFQARFVGVTIRGGRADFEGGGPGGNGGGIRTDGGTLTLTDVSVRDNQAPAGAGGGIFSAGELIATGTRVSGNTAVTGGGIFIVPSSTASLSMATVVGNRAAALGGGIANAGTLLVENSTFSGNAAGERGGGVDNDTGARASLTHATIAYNSAGVIGGGISTADPNRAVLRNTIVAYSISGGNCAGGMTDEGGNVTWPDATCPGTNANPQLGPLTAPGERIETHALLSGSAAIDAARDEGCLQVDQRGETRPQGRACDAGSVEATADPSLALQVQTPNRPARWGVGTRQRLAWSYAGPAAAFRIDISRDSGLTWTTIAEVENRPGQSQNFWWDVTGAPTTSARLRVLAVSEGVSDTNDADIVIAAPYIEILRPRAAATVPRGSHLRVFWSHNLGARAPVVIDISVDDGRSWTVVAAAATLGSITSSFTFAIVAPATSEARIRVRAVDGTDAEGVSARFAIVDAGGTASTETPP
jgi:CSLREA domain-containing protein